MNMDKCPCPQSSKHFPRCSPLVVIRIVVATQKNLGFSFKHRSKKLLRQRRKLNHGRIPHHQRTELAHQNGPWLYQKPCMEQNTLRRDTLRQTYWQKAPFSLE